MIKPNKPLVLKKDHNPKDNTEKLSAKKGFKDKLDFYEDNPVKSQLISNLISSLLTLAVLITTIIFSLNSLHETREQYKIAKGQLDNANRQYTLAKDQFEASKMQRKADLDSIIIREKRLRRKEYNDSINETKKEIQQQYRNKFQDSINKQQLSAIQLQAKTAKDQYETQKNTYQQQLNENRAILFISDVRLDSTRSSMSPDALFKIMNIGKRAAVILKSKLIAWNEFEPYYQPGVSVGTQVINENSTAELSIKVSQNCFHDLRTLYYINIFYTDTQDNVVKNQIFLFSWIRNPQKEFTAKSLFPSVETKFIKYIQSTESYPGQFTKY